MSPPVAEAALPAAVAVKPMAVPAAFAPVASSGKGVVGCKWQLVYYTNPNCGACQRIKPLLNQWEETYSAKLAITWVNVAEQGNWPQAQARGIRFTPSFILYTPQGEPHLDMTRELDVDLLGDTLNALPSPASAC
jgi:thiol-disulfide isomerase/thioredoxin